MQANYCGHAHTPGVECMLQVLTYSEKPVHLHDHEGVHTC